MTKNESMWLALWIRMTFQVVHQEISRNQIRKFWYTIQRTYWKHTICCSVVCASQQNSLLKRWPFRGKKKVISTIVVNLINSNTFWSALGHELSGMFLEVATLRSYIRQWKSDDCFLYHKLWLNVEIVFLLCRLVQGCNHRVCDTPAAEEHWGTRW